MRLTHDQIDMPDEVISALEDDRLVLFVGAGVSKPAPSNLPLFSELAEQLSEQTGFAMEKGEWVDRYLGRLDKHTGDVDGLVRAQLDKPNSKPNELHTALLSLFRSPRTVRIVTTNFDRHLTTAGRAAFGTELPIYFAPAVPLGRRFSGLVYLHGSLDQPFEQLILTDEDFGRAYLTDGWATQFLKGMFMEYTVLFLGYSHRDPVMQYLARGLPPESKPRYALTDKDDGFLGGHLGIIPVIYPVRAGEEEHGALVDLAKAWVEYVRMGFVEHHDRIRDIVKSPPTDDAQKNDYLLRCLKRTPTLRFFVDSAIDPQWLRWAFERRLLDRLFSSAAVTSDTDGILAQWVAERFACDSAEVVFAILRERGHQIHLMLWEALAIHLWSCKPRPDPGVFGAWVNILLRSAPQADRLSPHLDNLLKECHFPEDSTTALQLFDFLLAPLPEIEWAWPRSIGASDKSNVQMDVTVRGDRYWLGETWKRVFGPHLDVFTGQLIPIVTRHLQHAHAIFVSVGAPADEWFDPGSFSRESIEPSDPDLVPHALDGLIDAARNLIDWLLVSDIRRAQSVIADWEIAEAPLLKRLSIYAVSRHPQMSADDKLGWLLQKGWLYIPMRHEVFQLLKAALPKAGETPRASLVESTLRGPLNRDPESIKDKREVREVFNLLSWLGKTDPTYSKALAARNELVKANPDLHEGEDIDIGGRPQVGHVEMVSPITVDKLLEGPLDENIGLLLEFGPDPYTPGPNRYGLMSVVTGAAMRNFDWGVKLAALLKEKRNWQPDLWSAILSAWDNTALSPQQWAEIIRLLKTTPEIYATCGGEVSRLLRRSAEGGGLTDPLLSEAEVVAESFYASTDTEMRQPATGEPYTEKDWLQRAINHPAGRTVQFWFYGLSIRRRDAGDSWRGLPDYYKRCFTTVIRGETISSLMGTTLLLSELAFLFALDQDWTRANLTPLLDWSSDSQRAQCAWHGLLWAKLHRGLLPDLWPHFKQSYAELPKGLLSRRERFCELMAEIALFVSDNPVREGWLFDFLRHIEEEDRVKWASVFEYRLRFATAELRRKVWETWVDEYWRERQNGIPPKLADGEIHEMIEWAPQFGLVFPSVVNRICAKKVPDLKQTSVYHGLQHEGFGVSQPEATAKLLAHLLASAGEPFYHCYEATEIARQLAQAAAPPLQLADIRESLLRLGCSGASKLGQRPSGG